MKDTKWLIWSIEHNAWWRAAWQGYTEDKRDAGKYSFEEACAIVKGGNINTNKTHKPNEAMIKVNN